MGLPLPILMALMLTSPLHLGERLVHAAARGLSVVLLAAFALLVPRYSGLSPENGVQLGWPRLKVPDAVYRWAAAVNESVRRAHMSRFLPISTRGSSPSIIMSTRWRFAPTSGITSGQVQPEEFPSLVDAAVFSATPELVEATPEQFRDGLDRFEVRAVCLVNSPRAETARAILQQAGFRQTLRERRLRTVGAARVSADPRDSPQATSPVPDEPARGERKPGDSRSASVRETVRRGLYLLVTIPALNEEKTVGQVIRRVPRNIPGIGVVEVLVVDDGSEDRTAEEAERAGARVIRHPSDPRCGRSVSLRSHLRPRPGGGSDRQHRCGRAVRPRRHPGAHRAGGGRPGGVHHGVALQGPDADAADVLDRLWGNRMMSGSSRT